MKILPLLFFLLTFNPTHDVFAQMSNEKMEELLQQESQNVEGRLGNWSLEYSDTPVIIITDDTANRMRIFAPVLEEKDLKPGQLQKMLEANFHSALDAKYCLFEGLVISIFTHPLEELTAEQFLDALGQVVTLTKTFGTTYSSTDKIFGEGFKGKEAPKVNQSPSNGVKKS